MNEISKKHISKICTGVLNGVVSLSEAARVLAVYRDARDIKNYDAILLFDEIKAETENFPVGTERNNWSDESLSAKDIERAAVEAKYQTAARTACERLIDECKWK